LSGQVASPKIYNYRPFSSVGFTTILFFGNIQMSAAKRPSPALIPIFNTSMITLIIKVSVKKAPFGTLFALFVIDY